jgi:V-type H+-transporting ATPase subunit H
LRENLEALEDVLERNYRILSSFEKYNKEISTNKLSWGPCHSENFWKENVKRFEVENFKLVTKLVELLESDDVPTRAIACYDLGEFCRFHHFARK